MKTIISNTYPELLINDFNFVKTINRNKIDLAFEYECGFNHDIKSEILSKGIKIVGLDSRFDKINQTHILSRYDINHPNVYFNRITNSTIDSIDILNAFCDLEEFVVKPINGARGVGVKVISRNEYKKCLHSRDETKSIFKNEIEYANNVLCDVGGNFDMLVNQMLIQEKINVKTEYRLLLFKSTKCKIDYLCYERVKQPGQFLGNLSNGSKPRHLTNDEISESFDYIINKFNEILFEYQLPWLSIDVYEDVDGVIGIFEFQMEFAYEGFDYNLVKEKMVDALNYYIN